MAKQTDSVGQCYSLPAMAIKHRGQTDCKKSIVVAKVQPNLMWLNEIH